MNVRFSTAIMLKRNAKSKLNSGITSMEAKLPMILLVALTDEISTGMQIGNSKKDRRRVFPSENITSPEMKEPASARSTPPKIRLLENPEYSLAT